MTRVLEREREMARILMVAGGGGGDTLREFIRLAMDDPVKVAGFLGAIKVPTPESQQLQAIQHQLQQIQGQLNLQNQ
ncbi:uncharacterized protein LOC119549081 isoform X2 [Drosophila subpulchrella]|uniref:uncharacterized protein LOC119549081 isoform X2 n=1 Tax=Drosophila subpulchrella TaxID=1486046 RepID=UPI0018A161E2|nr:uncharacterized protein LOC119549081 isoform X2 [Drosophila subpulchrella]